MSEPIDLSADECKLVARKLRKLLGLFDPPRNRKGIVEGASHIERSFRTAWGWQLPPSSFIADADEDDLDEDGEPKQSPGVLSSGIRGKGGHGDPTLAAVLNSLGRRDEHDLSYTIMRADLEAVGDAASKLIADVTTVTPVTGSKELHDKIVPKKNRDRPCASIEQGCTDPARDNPRSSYCQDCFKWIDTHDGGVVPKHVIDTRMRNRRWRENKKGQHISGPLMEQEPESA